MERATSSLRFADVARAVGRQARALGLVVPGFRSPPRRPGVDRSLRRRADGGVVVAVRVRDRSFEEVTTDLVEGVLAANRLAGAQADRCRAALWAAVRRAEGTMAA